MAELTVARRTGSDTAPGDDMMTYSMSKNSGTEGNQLLKLINKSFTTGKLPTVWKGAGIVPVLKLSMVDKFRLSSLLSGAA